jgi:iron complex transport system ATP-binding protein
VPTPLLEASNLTVKRGPRTILEGVTLTLERGEVLGLVGPNGIGKSTLLDCLSGRLDPSSGRLEIDGQELRTWRDQERAQKLAFVPQKERPLFAFSVRELCSMGRLAWNQGWRESAEDLAAVDRALEKAGISHLAHHSILEISGGELQMALIARALAQESPLLLMDEPTSSLDLARHAGLSRILQNHVQRGGAAIVATHDINWALSLCSRLACLRHGGVDWVGPPQEAHRRLEECFGVPLRWVNDGPAPQVLTAQEPRAEEKLSRP